MGRRLPVYGLDIETDTSVDGLDPATSRVLTVALSQAGIDEMFVGFEHELLAELDDRLAQLEPGRVRHVERCRVRPPVPRRPRRALGAATRAATSGSIPTIRLQHAPLPGHAGAYRAAWHHHGHLDAYRLYRDDVHDLTTEAMHAYASSDARLARVLTERRWASAAAASSTGCRSARTSRSEARRPAAPGTTATTPA